MLLKFSTVLLAVAAISAHPLQKIQKYEITHLNTKQLNRLLADPQIPKAKAQIVRFSQSQLKESRQPNEQKPNLHFDAAQTLDIQLGTPGKRFRLSLESGVREVFVFDSSFANATRPDHVFYDPANSTSSDKIRAGWFSSESAGVSVSGDIYHDQMTLSNQTFEQHFGSVTWVSVGRAFPADGVFGLGWDPAERENPAPDSAPIYNLLKALDAEKVYSVVAKDSELNFLWGQRLDATFVSTHTWQHRPSVHIRQFDFGKYTDVSLQHAIVDTGYSVIAMPTVSAAVVTTKLDADFDPATGLYMVDCGVVDSAADLEFSVKYCGCADEPDDGKYTISAKDYVVMLPESTFEDKCVLAVATSEHEGYFLGRPFFADNSVVFDIENGEIGFAVNKPAEEPKEPEPKEPEEPKQPEEPKESSEPAPEKLNFRRN